MSRRAKFTTTSRIQRAPQILRVHLAELGNDSFQLTVYAATDRLSPGRIIALEPSRNTIIMEIPGIGIQIGDWMRNRTVEITTSGLDNNLSVFTIPRMFIVRRNVLKVTIRCPSLVYV